MNYFVNVFILCLLITGCSSSGSDGQNACMSLDCLTSKYNLLVVDVDLNLASPEGTNISVIATSEFQDMTHPRVSPDKNWVAYTTYNVTNEEGCASLDSGYMNTEIMATRMDGSETKRVIPVTSGELNCNSYWYGNNFEFTFLSGAPGSTSVYRAQTDAEMNVIASSMQVTIPATITPYDPQAISNSRIVYGGLYDNTGWVKSIFLQSLNPSDSPVGLTLGRDSSGNILYNDDIMENDPKLSPDGKYVAFMRYAPNSGVNGFGWRIFVVQVKSPLSEENISASLGDSLLNNDALPEWVDNTTLVFVNIDLNATFNTRTIHVMQRDGSGRRQVMLPDGYRYSDVYPFRDNQGNQKLVISAEKIDAVCAP
jgi:Tol biopolymer transport system component